MLRHSLLIAMMFAAATATKAANSELRPGKYVLEGNHGDLVIHGDRRNKLTFKIESIGANCHICFVSGEISGSIGQADTPLDEGNDSRCRISFSTQGAAVVVSPITEEACRHHCGYRAGFEGTYRAPPTVCTQAGQRKLRDSFSQQYRARKFSQASATLQRLVAQCKGLEHFH